MAQKENVNDHNLALSQQHREYLLQRHGTVDLNPLPSADPADPYNWPTWKKVTNLVVISFMAFSAGFIAAGVIPAFEPISQDLGISLQTASYLVSMQIALLGFGPFFWIPISKRFGRRPVWLLASVVSCVCNIGAANCHTYGTLSVCRCIGAWFLSPVWGAGSGVVVETFFAGDRGKAMGIWTVFTTLGVPMGPLLMGFVAYRLNYSWIFWIFAIMNGVQFILHLGLTPETRYIRSEEDDANLSASAFKKEYLQFRRIDPTPFSLMEFISPLFLARHITITIPALSYGLVFSLSSVFLTTIVPQLYIPKFGFNPQQLGLQFLGLIIGTIIGEQASGPLSDYWMNLRRNRLGRDPVPEYRLWVSYLGFATVIIGIVVFCVQTEDLQPNGYNVSPIVGAGFAAFGNQVVTTVLVTYAVDSHPTQGAQIGVFVNMSRQVLGFTGPFWYPDMVASLGLKGSAGLFVGLVAGVSIVPIIGLQLRILNGRERGVDGIEHGSNEASEEK